MREILFRGKTDKGEWVYGDLIQLHNGRRFIINNKFGACIDDKGNFINTEAPFVYDVIPETVGQYTGLTDKNGTKIFEGDLLRVTDDNGETNLCSCGVGYVLFYDGVWYICDEVNDGLYDVNNIYYIEVIGNIHDNPELLKGGAE